MTKTIVNKYNKFYKINKTNSPTAESGPTFQILFLVPLFTLKQAEKILDQTFSLALNEYIFFSN